MAAAYRSGSNVATASAVAAVPVGLADGDLWIVNATRNTTTPPSLPAGWTDIGTSIVGTSLRCAYKIVTSAASETAVTFTNATSNDSFAVTGYDATTVLDAVAVAGGVGGVGITTVTADALLVLCQRLSSAAASTAATSPLTILNAASATAHTAVGTQATAGASGNKTITGGSTPVYLITAIRSAPTSTPVNTTDSGLVAGTDVSTLATSRTATDSGLVTGADVSTLATSRTVTDSGLVTGTDTAIVTKLVVDTGLVTGTDASSLLIPLTVTDTGLVSATESATVTVTVLPVSVTDGGLLTGTEASSVGVAVTVTDSGLLSMSDATSIATYISIEGGRWHGTATVHLPPTGPRATTAPGRRVDGTVDTRRTRVRGTVER